MKRFEKTFWIVFVTLILVFYENCSMVGRPQEYRSTTSASALLEQEAMKVINGKCVSCHNPQSAGGGVDYLTNVDTLLYYRMIVPGEPQLSYLYNVISNGSMPPAPGSLNTAEIKAIYDWIQDGFKNPSGIGVTPPPTSNVLEAKFASINRLILQPKCTNCHNATNSSGGVSFATYASTMNTVQPGNINASSFYTSVNSKSMPRNGTPLTQNEILVIQTWIQNGAPNN